MSREWKPGDVADVTSRGNVRAFRTDEGWTYVDGSTQGLAADRYSFRPLVVIDTEFPATVVRHLRIAAENDCALTTLGWLADQIEAQTALPKPDEPLGLGAVVEAMCGCSAELRRFVRDPDARDFNLPHDAAGAATGAEVPWVSQCGHHDYAALSVVRVLSEGIS